MSMPFQSDRDVPPKKEAVGDVRIEQATLGAALGVLANVCATYIGAVRHSKPDATDDDMKKLHQMCVAILIHNIVGLSKHKAEMAGILDVIAAELRDELLPDVPRVMVNENADEPKAQ